MNRSSVWVLLLMLVWAFGADTCVAAVRNVDACLAKDDAWDSTEHKRRMRELGINCATVYYSLLSTGNRKDPYAWIKTKYLDAGYRVVLVLKIDRGNTTAHSRQEPMLASLVAGDYDAELRRLIKAIKDDGRPIVVRPFHEIDGNWHPWGMYLSGNSLELAVDAVRHVSTLFRTVEAPVSIEINFNRRDAKGNVLGEAEWYVPLLDPFVDAYAISSYNRCGSAPGRTMERTFAEEFRPAYERLVSLTEKPINIAEVSTTGLCSGGVKMPWFVDMVHDVNTIFDRVHQVTFVFGVVPVGAASNTVPIDWGLSYQSDREQFRDLLDEYWVPASPAPTPRHDRPVNPSKPKDFRAPFAFYTRLSLPLDESDNPALNPATGTSFGETGPLFRGHVKQRALWEVSEGVEVGPGIKFGLVESPVNEQQWWNNQLHVEASLGLYGQMSRKQLDWGNWSLELVARRTKFTTGATPDRYGDRQDSYIGLEFTVNGEVDLAR